MKDRKEKRKIKTDFRFRSFPNRSQLTFDNKIITLVSKALLLFRKLVRGWKKKSFTVSMCVCVCVAYILF